MRSRLWGIRGAALAVRCRYNSPVDEMLLRSHSPPSWCSSGHASVIANCLTTKSTASARRLKTCSDYTQPDFDMTSGQTPRTECSISSFANVSICYCGSYKLLLSSNKGNQGVQQPPILMASPAPRATQSGKTTPPPILDGVRFPENSITHEPGPSAVTRSSRSKIFFEIWREISLPILYAADFIKSCSTDLKFRVNRLTFFRSCANYPDSQFLARAD